MGNCPLYDGIATLQQKFFSQLHQTQVCCPENIDYILQGVPTINNDFLYHLDNKLM